MAIKKKKKLKKIIKKTVKKNIKKVIKKPAVAKKNKSKVKKTVKKKIKSIKVKAQAPIKTKVVPVLNVDYSKAITPLADRLVVRVLNAERMTSGGLIIPDSAASVATGYLKATVLAVGTGSKNKKGMLKPMDVKVGDTILFAEHAGTPVMFNAEELQIINESDVMVVVQN